MARSTLTSSELADAQSTISRWGPMCAGILVFIVTHVVICRWTGESDRSALNDVAWILLTSGPLVAAWIGAAFGFGNLLCACFARGSLPWHVQIAAGTATLMLVDQIFGTLGLLQLGGGVAAIIVLALGLGLAAWRFAISRKQLLQTQAILREGPAFDYARWLSALAGVPLAVLVAASCAAPGALWATEFGGYDALSYHLQLPKEWLALGSIRPLTHNVYSFLPNYVEGAYYHLAILKSDAISAAYACQLLHAAATILSAISVAHLANRLFRADSASAAGLLFLGTPWVIVTGSLAYNESFVIFMLCAALHVLVSHLDCHDTLSEKVRRDGLILGLLIGAACGAKLTSAGMVALPIVAILLILRPRRWSTLIALSLCAAFIYLTPYMVRNYIASSNPVFPFATSLFGTAHWDEEQARIWSSAHHNPYATADSLHQLWHQYFAFGWGRNPSPSEPWKPQWGLLPIMGFGCLLGAAVMRTSRRTVWLIATILASQLCFWLLFTHLKSRFLLPTAIPLALGCAFLPVWITSSLRSRFRNVYLALTTIVIAAHGMLPLLIFRSEGNGAPAALIGQDQLLSGIGLDEPLAFQAGTEVIPAVGVNRVLPDGAKVLLLGHATPFYFDLNRISYQTTWDRGLLSTLMRTYPDDTARWRHELLAHGYTHLLVDDTMLSIWEKSGWNDPLLTRERVHQFTASHAELMWKYPNNISLFRLTR